jgi:hypothetical protein
MRVVTCSADMAVRVCEVTSAPLPVPDWLPALAEAIAGQHIDAQEVSEVVSVERLYQLREQLAANTEQSYYGRYALDKALLEAQNIVRLRNRLKGQLQ